MSGLSPIGQSWADVKSNLQALRNGIKYMPEWEVFDGLRTRLAAPVRDFEQPKHYTRKARRTMGHVAQLSVRASEIALEDAGLIGHKILTSGQTGVSYGSSTGSTDSIREFATMFFEKSCRNIGANTYIKMMPHTTAANIGIFFGLTGRMLPSSSSCTSGSLSIGMAFESIRAGFQTIMLAGGAEELCVSEAAAFDTLYATSTKNDTPDLTPQPFDRDRDGLVIGEGAGTLILEDMGHAIERGANICAELVGFGTNSDGKHPTQPSPDTMAQAMRLALNSADLPGDAIGFISAHGTATDLGDVAESQATYSVFKRPVPISSLKSYTGHTLGACGALEAWMSIHMMNEDWVSPTLNLRNIDPLCADLDYISGQCQSLSTEYFMTNNFAFGGVNTSLIFKRWGT
jgi:3-oxoacyl-[acyl-carrier-protein] synthase II